LRGVSDAGHEIKDLIGGLQSWEKDIDIESLLTRGHDPIINARRIFSVFIIAFYGPPETERSSCTKRGGCFNDPSLRYGAGAFRGREFPHTTANTTHVGTVERQKEETTSLLMAASRFPLLPSPSSSNSLLLVTLAATRSLPQISHLLQLPELRI